MYASMAPSSQFFGRTLIAGADPREIALTFDDGPNDAATPQLLDVLARRGVRATFFLIGGYARQRPDLVRDIASAGHLIGNHTMTHPNLSLAPTTQVRQELTECSALLEQIAGTRIRFFRPPFGAHRPVVLRIARELGMVPVMWNVMAYDWEEGRGLEKISQSLDVGIAKNQEGGRGSNVLLHDGGHKEMGAPRLDTVRAAERLLEAHAEAASRFVTVDAWKG